MEKIAFIEINEAFVNLSIFKVNGPYKKIVLTQNQPIQFGKEIYSNELLSPQTKNKVLDILKMYRKMIESFEVEKIYAFANDIITKARNYRGFIDEIYNNTGISFQILYDEDQIKCLFNSIVNSIDTARGVFVYVGAFSSYIVKYNRRSILGSVIIPYGTYNVNENEDTNLDNIVKLIKSKTNAKELLGEDGEELKFIGLGNAFLAMGRIAKKIDRYPLNVDENYTISKETVEKTYDFIKGLDLEKIRKIKGVNFDEADKMANGFAIIKGLTEAVSLSEVTISSSNILNGMLNINALSNTQERFNDLLSNSLENYYEFAKDEFSINKYVHNLAIVLFKQLKVMHKLPRFYVKPLRIASFMYDCGKCINDEDWTKHGFEKIVYSDLKGVSHRELLLAGFICVCQNLDDFSLNEWIKYKDILTEEDLDAARKLGIIVKLAVNLNASRKPIIQDVICDILGDSIIMKTIAENDASYEIMEGMKVAPDYRKVYKKSLQII